MCQIQVNDNIGSKSSMTRFASLKDMNTLLKIERNCFATDQLSWRNFQYLLTRAHAQTLIAEDDGVILGYAMLLFRKGSSIARLYSFALDLQFQRQGIAAKLLHTAEDCARKHNCISLRLETRQDNVAMQALVRKNGYRQFGVIANYYQDNTEALRFEKLLILQHYCQTRTYHHIKPQVSVKNNLNKLKINTKLVI